MNNKTSQLLAGLVLGGLLAAAPAPAQSDYATPYTFVTLAGLAGNYGGNDGTNSDARFYYPEGTVVDTNGNVYVVDYSENTVRKLTPVGTNWVVTTIAGTTGSSGGSADGTNGAAQFSEPTSIAMDGAGNLYVTDSGNNTIRKLAPAGTNWVSTTIAGLANGSSGSADGTNQDAQFTRPTGIAADAGGNLYVADTDNQTIRKLTSSGTNWVVTTIAGTLQTTGSADGTNDDALFFEPSGLAVDGAGNLYVADTFNNAIRKLTPAGTNWVVTTIAGSPPSYGGTDGTNQAALFNFPYDLAADQAGNLFVADTFNNTIRKITPSGTNWVTTTLAGAADGSSGSTDGTGAGALFSNPDGIAVDGAGRLFVGDTANGTIRMGQIPVVTSVPNLAISLAAPNTVTVSWPVLGSYTLQTNGVLTTTNWGNYGGAPAISNGTNSITISPPVGNLFFRLAN
ncbi:MAG TPA: NHL repeat-containing protein [Verrucomicrobiae bacterium]